MSEEKKTAEQWYKDWEGNQELPEDGLWDGWRDDKITYREFAKRVWDNHRELTFEEDEMDVWDREMKEDYNRGLLDDILERAKKEYINEIKG